MILILIRMRKLLWRGIGEHSLLAMFKIGCANVKTLVLKGSGSLMIDTHSH